MNLLIATLALIGMVVVLAFLAIFICEKFNLWDDQNPEYSEEKDVDDKLIKRIQESIEEENNLTFMQ